MTPARARRTHAERTAETRDRVMTAVVEAINEVGFGRTTANEIAKRAGVTWGAVQHHFGDKNGILAAVLEASFDRFAERLGDVPDEPELEKRVGLFVERAWGHFSSAEYRTTFEILQNLPDEIEVPWQRQMLGHWGRIWARWFPQSDPQGPQTIDLQLYTVAVLSGLASTRNLDRAGSDRGWSRPLRMLAETLTTELERQGATDG